MNTIHAIVRGGKLEVENPINLPDGTVLTIPFPEALSEQQERSRESIEEWEEWYKSLEPWEMTEEERATWDKAREEDKQRELSQWEARAKTMDNLFP